MRTRIGKIEKRIIQLKPGCLKGKTNIRPRTQITTVKNE